MDLFNLRDLEEKADAPRKSAISSLLILESVKQRVLDTSLIAAYAEEPVKDDTKYLKTDNNYKFQTPEAVDSLCF